MSGSDVYVGGSFSRVYNGPNGTGAVAVEYVARWTGTAWRTLGGGTDGTVRALAVSGSDVYVGGSFSNAYNGPGRTGAVSGTRNVARWNGTAWQTLGGGTTSFVDALAVSGSDVYVAGTYLRVSRWTGTAWQTLGGGTSGGDIYAIAVSGSDVYVGGRFTAAYNSPGQTDRVAGTPGVARWTGTAWQALAGGVNKSVSALAIGQAPPASPAATFPAGASVKALFLGGSFTEASDGTPADFLTYYTEGTNLSVGVTEAPARPRDLALTVLSNATAAPRLRIDMGGPAQEVTVEVFDLLGRRLSSERMGVEGRREVAVGASLTPGVYVVRARTATATETIPVVVR